jgi:hypothetical protein
MHSRSTFTALIAAAGVAAVVAYVAVVVLGTREG